MSVFAVQLDTSLTAAAALHRTDSRCDDDRLIAVGTNKQHTSEQKQQQHTGTRYRISVVDACRDLGGRDRSSLLDGDECARERVERCAYVERRLKIESRSALSGRDNRSRGRASEQCRTGEREPRGF